MPERVFLVSASQADLARGSVVPPQMIEDLLTVSQVPAEAIDTLATSLQAAPGFLDSESFEQIVLKSLADDRLASAVVRTLENLNPESIDRTLRTVSHWREADPGNAAIPGRVVGITRRQAPTIDPGVSRRRTIPEGAAASLDHRLSSRRCGICLRCAAGLRQGPRAHRRDAPSHYAQIGLRKTE